MFFCYFFIFNLPEKVIDFIYMPVTVYIYTYIYIHTHGYMYIHGTVPQWIAVTAYKCAFCCRMGLERVSFLECSMHQSLCPATLWDLLSNIKKARRQNIMLGSLQIISGVTKPIPFVALSWLRWETRIPISQHVIKSQKRTNHLITAHNYAGNLLFSKPFVGGEPRPGNLHKQPT